jgi:hypothetical protein
MSLLRESQIGMDDGIDDLLPLVCLQSYLRTRWWCFRLLEHRQHIVEKRYVRSRHRLVITRQSLPKLTKDLAWDEWMPQLHISRDSFRMLVYLIESHPVFSNNSPCQQLPVWDQLVVFLRFMVLPGDTDATLASDMGLDVGTISKVVGRVTRAILSLFDDYVKWPSPEERRNIASNTALPGCIGFLDGTHFDLKFRPQFQTETFFSYKKRYSIAAQIVATSDREIIYAHTGFYGSWHDSRQFKETGLYKNFEQYLSEDQYIVADKAYPISKRLIVPYRRNQRRAASPMEANFNKRVTEELVVVERTIGDLKARYPRLDNVTAKIKKREDAKKINDLIECGCILHNFLRKFPRDNMSVEGADIDVPSVEAAFDEAAATEVDSNNGRDEGKQRREEIARFIFER